MASIPDAVLLSPATFQTTVFRICPPVFANVRDAISGNGAYFAPGRYHTKSAFRIVYTATSLEQAWAEYFGTLRHAGMAVEDLLPVTVFAIETRLSRVLDLTDDSVRNALGVSLDGLLADDWILPQEIGKTAFDVGYEALLVPSKTGEANLNVLVENLLPGSTFEIRNADKLPPAP